MAAIAAVVLVVGTVCAWLGGLLVHAGSLAAQGDGGLEPNDTPEPA